MRPPILLAVAAAITFVFAACQDGQFSSAPPAPPANPNSTSQLMEGYVDGNTGTVTFTPLGFAPNVFGSASPAIYGNQGTTLTIFGKVDSMITVAGTRRTWYIRIGVRNLQSFPIGSNYGSAAPPDTSGIFVGFTVLPSPTFPSPCACTISVINASGTGNFTLGGQPYFWYRSRPTAVQGAPGTDTTRGNPEWQFRATTFTPPDTAHSFSFVLLVNAAWPTANEVLSSTVYDGLTDTIPDSTAEPRWRMFVPASVRTIGIESWSTSGLALTVANAKSIYFSRRDSLGTMPAYLRATLSVANSNQDRLKAVFGFAEPIGGGRRQFMVGVWQTSLSFVSFDDASGNWTKIGTNVTFDGTVMHNYMLRKIGTTSAVLCVDGSPVATLAYTSTDTVRTTFAQSSVVFGADGAPSNSQSLWTSVTYTIGSDGGGCF